MLQAIHRKPAAREIAHDRGYFSSLLSERQGNILKSAIAFVSVAIAILPTAAGCSARQAYNTGQAWQRNECNKIVDAAELQRCLRGTNTSYDDYQREVEDAKSR